MSDKNKTSPKTRVYYMDRFGQSKDFWSDEDPLTHFPWIEDKSSLVFIMQKTERGYYLSQVPEEFRQTVEEIAHDHANPCGTAEVTRVVRDVVNRLAPCFHKFKLRVCEELDDQSDSFEKDLEIN